MIKILSVDTIPYANPMKAGQQEPTGTTLTIDPKDDTAWVWQYYYTGSTPYGREYKSRIDIYLDDEFRPDETKLKEYLESFGQMLLMEITRGKAYAFPLLLKEIGHLPTHQYAIWDVGDYLDPVAFNITAQTTDEEIAKLAAEIDESGEGEELDDHIIIIDGDVTEYFTNYRDELQEEKS